MASSTCLINLPDDLLHEIIGVLQYNTRALLSFNTTCRRLWALSLPCLYRSLAYVIAYTSYTNPFTRDGPPNSTAIRYIDLLLRNLRRNPLLGGYVRSVHADWERKAESDSIRELLHYLPNLQTVYLSPPALGETADIDAYSPNLPITSLQVHHQALTLGGKAPLNFNGLFKIMKRPSLRTLELDFLMDWSIAGFLPTIDRSGVSLITGLILRPSGFGGPGLTEVLTWPKGLTLFHIEIMTGDNRDHRVVFSPRDLVNALRPQSSSLQTLYFSGAWYCTDLGDGSVVGNLHHFTALKSLHIPMHWMVYCIGDPRLSGTSIRGATICEHLPPSLEVLVLEIGKEDFIAMALRRDKRMNPPLEQVVDWVVEILDRKKSYTPLLKRLEIVQSGWSRQYLFENNMAHCMNLAAVCAGVELSLDN